MKLNTVGATNQCLGIHLTVELRAYLDKSRDVCKKIQIIVKLVTNFAASTKMIYTST